MALHGGTLAGVLLSPPPGSNADVKESVEPYIYAILVLRLFFYGDFYLHIFSSTITC
jgi:hypothetical protein